MNNGARFRGQPLFLLAGVLIGWTGLRVVMWQPEAEGMSELAPVARGDAARRQPARPPAFVAGQGPVMVEPETAVPVRQQPETRSAPPGWIVPTVPAPLPPINSFSLGSPQEPGPTITDPVAAPGHMPARAVVGHNLLLAAGLSQMEIPEPLLAYLQPAGSQEQPTLGAAPAPSRPAVVSRWSADGWLMLRDDTISPVQAGLPSYGRSQAGAVLRYQLAPSTRRRPQAYARVSGAIAGERDQEVAAGLSVRPVPAVPLRVAAEGRVARSATRTEVRPAAYAVTELPPANLPLGTRGELYAQGGYVGGSNATAFIDAQGRIERPLSTIRGVEFTAGAGAWGGAQKGATRFDIGPTAAVTFKLGEGRGRLSADYRIRVAGDAEPKSGPALTLSAGF